MYLNKVLISMVTAFFVVVFSACNGGPISPDSPLTINPTHITVEVGASQNFVVSGGRGEDYNFSAYECLAVSGGSPCSGHSSFFHTFRLEKVGPREAKLTILSANAYNGFFFVGANSVKDRISATVSVPWP